jgi:hypothetical protein
MTAGVRHSWRSRRGMASALIIMILVLLIFFAVLGLVASAADLRLAQKRADWNRQFYIADAGAVQLFADLDQFFNEQGGGGQTGEPESGQDALAAALQQWLAMRQDIREYRVAVDTGWLTLNVLTTGIPEGQEAESQQGIAMTLRLRTNLPSASGQEITMEITGWQQWQMPFEYDSENGGVWEG